MSNAPDSNEPEPQSNLHAPNEENPPATTPLEAVTDGIAIGGLHAAAYALAAWLVAGILAWGIGEKTYDYYRSAGKAGDSRDFTAMNREKGIGIKVNSAIAFGTFGAILGILSGAAGGALRRWIPGGASAALVGLLLGGIGGAVVSYGLAPIFARLYSDESPSLVLSFLVRGGIWAVVGMTAGLALGWGWQGLRGVPRALIGGLAGGVCGTIGFEVVNAVLFPADRNDAVIPSSMQTRLLAYLLVAVGVAIGAVVLGRLQSRPAGRNSRAHS